MKATNIAYLTGRMRAILDIMEFRIQQPDMKDYQTDYLIEQVNEARAVNGEIFEMHKKNELDRIKKSYNE